MQTPLRFLRIRAVIALIIIWTTRPCVGVLVIEAPSEVTGQACQSVVVTARLINRYEHPVRVAEPDGYFSLECLYNPSPMALRGLLGHHLNPILIPEPPGVIELQAGEAYEFTVALDRAHRCGLLPGEANVSIRYLARSGSESWALSPEVEATVTSEPIHVRIEPPATTRDREALAIYAQHYPAAWHPELAALFRPVSAGELLDLADPLPLARSLQTSRQPLVRSLFAGLKDSDRRLIGLVSAGDTGDKYAQQLRELVNAWIRDPALVDDQALDPGVLSPTAQAQSVALPPEGDVSVRNRAVLEDLLPGLLPQTLFRLVYEYADTPYAPIALYCIALRYAPQPERSLYWLDRLERLYPDEGLEEDVDLLRFGALVRLGRLAEAREVAEQMRYARQRSLAQVIKLELQDN